ncbi:hypothetical protein Bca4012_076690 [Brassica carinata]|nr:unnamed protein product [Brassica napus]VDD36368.1 unnamed protein product [Brassica oleracea]
MLSAPCSSVVLDERTWFFFQVHGFKLFPRAYKDAKTDKPAILDDAIRVMNQLRGEAYELKETNQKLLEEIKTLKLKSMAVPSPGFLPSHPAAFHQNIMAVYASYGYYPNMPMMPYLLPPSQRDTSQDQQNCCFAA